MAIDFNASLGYVNHGSGASLDNLDAQSWIVWGYPNSITNTNRRLARKSGGDILTAGNISAANGRIRYNRLRATTASVIESATNTVTVATWQFFFALDSDGVAPVMYRGTLAALATEISYATQTTGSGASADDSADNLLIGSRDVATAQADWRVAYLWVYNRRLTVAEALQHQFAPWTILTGCVLKTAYFSTVHLADLSGTGNNGTLSGSPVNADHVPLGPPFAFRSQWRGAFTAAGAAATYPGWYGSRAGGWY